MTNEELFYLLQKFYPGTINGTHYLTGHRLDTEGKQLGEAFLQYWRLPDPEPTRGQLVTLWLQHGDEIKATVAGVHHRWERNERLLKADALVYRAEDAGDEVRAKAARKYRQALRDVPQLAGFPYSFTWPVPPEEDEVENVARRDAVLREVEKEAANPHPVASMPADLIPPETSRAVVPEPPPPPSPQPVTQEADAELVLEGELGEDGYVKPPPPPPVRLGDEPPPDPSPDPPPFVPPVDPPPGPPIDPLPPEPEPGPFQPSPQPDFVTLQDPQNAAEIALSADPVTKLTLFLQANPDVAQLIEENVAPPDPAPTAPPPDKTP